MAALRRTGLLVRAGIGYDIIDVDAATDAGIWVANVPDYCVDEVADHALLLLLSAWRRLTELERVWHAGAWVNASLVHRSTGSVGDASGSSIRRIGRAVAQRARAGFARSSMTRWSPTIVLPTRRAGRRRAVRRRRDPLHARSTPVTVWQSARPTGTPGDSSRGQGALEAALDDGRIAAVSLDVLDDEPAPDLTRTLYQRPNVLLTPHLAWYSIEARRDLALQAAEEAFRYVSGGAR